MKKVESAPRGFFNEWDIHSMDRKPNKSSGTDKHKNYWEVVKNYQMDKKEDSKQKH